VILSWASYDSGIKIVHKKYDDLASGIKVRGIKPSRKMDLTSFCAGANACFIRMEMLLELAPRTKDLMPSMIHK
jgi:hypothetical protein